MQLTLEERERQAYIEGRVGEAALLQQAIDAETDALDEMRHERDMARDEANDVDAENDRLRDEIEALETKLQDVTAERDDLCEQLANQEQPLA